MIDTRRKNTNWAINGNSRGIPTTESAQLAVLMDIRDELQTLNAVFQCYRFQGIPSVLNRIAKNTAKPKPAKK